MSVTVDIVIPVYKPDAEFGEMLRRLDRQTCRPGAIFLMHTEDGRDLSHLTDRYKYIVEIPVRYGEFDHGKTRDEAFQRSGADIVVCMTQDAMPKDRFLLEELIRPLEAADTAMSYARQIPREDSRLTEKFIRAYNYPKESMVKSEEDLQRLGIKTYFCSNVCAAYKRDVYLQLGGFERHVPLNEDMLYAVKCMKKGWKICYAADAGVIHSHNYTYAQQFRRNFDIAVSQAMHAEVFQNISSEREGVRLVKQVVCFLFKKGRLYSVPYFAGECAARYLGFFFGKHYDRLPQSVVKKCSLDTRFWDAGR